MKKRKRSKSKLTLVVPGLQVRTDGHESAVADVISGSDREVVSIGSEKDERAMHDFVAGLAEFQAMVEQSDWPHAEPTPDGLREFKCQCLMAVGRNITLALVARSNIDPSKLHEHGAAYKCLKVGATRWLNAATLLTNFGRRHADLFPWDHEHPLASVVTHHDAMKEAVRMLDGRELELEDLQRFGPLFHRRPPEQIAAEERWSKKADAVAATLQSDFADDITDESCDLDEALGVPQPSVAVKLWLRAYRASSFDEVPTGHRNTFVDAFMTVAKGWRDGS